MTRERERERESKRESHRWVARCCIILLPCSYLKQKLVGNILGEERHHRGRDFREDRVFRQEFSGKTEFSG